MTRFMFFLSSIIIMAICSPIVSGKTSIKDIKVGCSLTDPQDSQSCLYVISTISTGPTNGWFLPRKPRSSGGETSKDIENDLDSFLPKLLDKFDDFQSNMIPEMRSTFTDDLTINRQFTPYRALHMWNHLSNPNDKKPEQVDWDAIYEENERQTKEKWDALPAIVKGFYQEHPEVSALTDEQVDQFRRNNNNIVVSHFKKEDTYVLPKPAIQFAHAFHNHPDILDAIASQNFKTPSPIQSQAWPILLQGKDLIGIAQTGTGKTLAYLLPGLLSIVHQTVPRNKRPGPSVLILAPTRELAQQIDKEAKKYSYQNIKSLCIYGGGNRSDQIAECRKRPEIIIATPGRLNDLTSNNLMDLTAVNYVVLDEADRMLDMGFMPQIRKILVDIRPDRQTVMMSATWPPGVRKIANDFMNNPAQIFVGTLDLAAVNSVSQEIIMTEQDQKRQLLYDFLLKTMSDTDKAIVFVGRKSVADDISSELALNDIACQCMHGDRDQADREQALADFKSGAVRIIIATDVASRGLDIDDITYILNYDFPSNAEEYVHRVGRTGRAGRTGKSITFFTREDWRHAQELIDILSKSSSEVPEKLQNMAARYQAWLDKKKAEDEAAYNMPSYQQERRPRRRIT